MMEIKILCLADINDQMAEEIAALFKQLSPQKKQLPLTELLKDGNPISFVYCLIDQHVAGIASICTYQVISGTKGWIEDVVVNKKYRGRGIGKKLIEKILEIGHEKKLKEILLYTEDHREAALNLYQGIGFQAKESKIYYIKNEQV
ncbi:GNAT family N-acetyltransferase [Sphingobacterium faecium]|uniref:GNAT family N-acetyltransferase n=1 Tax=Sphingobacterium faecium TaxID=34087 RepID=UPI003208C769